MMVPCRCLDEHVKEHYEMSMALGARPYVQIPSSVCLHNVGNNCINFYRVIIAVLSRYHLQFLVCFLTVYWQNV